MIAAAGGRAAELAGEIGDGLISTIANDSLVRKFRVSDGGSEKPRYGQVTVCWAKTEDEAKKIAKEWWAVAAIPGELMSQLATPAEFEAVAQFVDEKAVAAKIICGPDPDRHLEEIETYRKAGFDRVYIHQVGPDQNGFFEFYQREILPKFK
jgi:G6PDH family F420-dependent oxidoreductase